MCDASVAVPQTGEQALTRSSAAAIDHVAAPPPEMPVTPSRVASTSGRAGQQVEPADAVQHLDRGRRVAAAVPVEPALAVAAVMIAGHLTKLHGLHDQRRKAELCKPLRMTLIVDLLFLHVAAHVENPRLRAVAVAVARGDTGSR